MITAQGAIDRPQADILDIPGSPIGETVNKCGSGEVPLAPSGIWGRAPKTRIGSFVGAFCVLLRRLAQNPSLFASQIFLHLQ